VTSLPDLYRATKGLIQQYGTEDALLFAARRADVLLELGELEGQRVWKGVLRTVEELGRMTPKGGESVN
jgi:hypothetical protein